VAVLSLTEDLQRHGLQVAGVASPRVLAAGKTIGYRVRDLATGEERPLCLDRPPGIPFRRFFFSPEGLAFANALIEQAAREAKVIVVDEVGPLELAGGGFAPGLRAALQSRAFLVLTVRPSLVNEVRRWAEVKTAVTLDAPPAGLRSRNETRQLFDDSASSYGSWGGSAGPLTGYAESLAKAAELVQVGPGERLLDIGIGTGSFAAQIAQSDTEVWGVDLSTVMLSRCREDHPGYHLREGHFLSLPVPDGAFHAVVSSFAFHHLAPAEYERAFREILRALVPGGGFVLLDVLFASEPDRQAARVALGDLWDDEEVYPLVPAVEAAASQAGAAGLVSHRVSPLHWVVSGMRPLRTVACGS
jgi:ubiquinone/menaquinone biosynthesis C-methylase UbiE/nucleoside-triphosphatase THEP1